MGGYEGLSFIGEKLVIDSFALYKIPGGWNIPGPPARGTDDSYTLPGRDLSCLPGDWLNSRHMALV